MAGAVGSTALGSHFGASLEDHGPNVVLYRAGPQTARRAGSLRGHDHSRQSSSSPKPLPDRLQHTPIIGLMFEERTVVTNVQKRVACEVRVGSL